MVKSRSRIYPLLSEEQIRLRVRELGTQITSDYAGKDWTWTSISCGWPATGAAPRAPGK